MEKNAPVRDTAVEPSVGSVFQYAHGRFEIVSIDGEQVTLEFDNGIISTSDIASLGAFPDLHPPIRVTECRPKPDVIKIEGDWDEGYAACRYTKKIVFLGTDEFGTRQFRNEYSYIGDMLHRCKYDADASMVVPIADRLESLLALFRPPDAIVSVPPTDQKRSFQPVLEIASELGKRAGIPVYNHVFSVVPHRQMKHRTELAEKEEILRRSIRIDAPPETHNKRVLVLDDVYRSGATLSVVCGLLRQLGPKWLCVLAIAKATKDSK
jgi:adenine/guanine phosphoribosyltransferase-like PRPP-binding protein